MIYLYFGTDSDKAYEEFLNKKKGVQNATYVSDSKELNLTTITQLTEPDIFGNNSSDIFLENLSNSSEEVIEFIGMSKLNYYVFEKKEPGVKFLKNFNEIKKLQFEYPKLIFTFIENLKPNNHSYLVNNYHELLKQTAPEAVFGMLIRQFRILIAIKSNSNITEIGRLSWQKPKLLKQADLFSSAYLKAVYTKLIKIDINRKTGKSDIDLTTQIDFFLASI